MLDKSKLTLVGSMFIISAVVFSWVEYSKPQINDKNDLCFVKGHLIEYKQNKNLGKYTIHTFRIRENQNTFKIKADFLGGFENEKFEKLPFDSEIIFSISKSDEGKLNFKNNILYVFTIVNQQTAFLNFNYTIEKHKSKFGWYASLFFFILGIIILLIMLKKLRNK